MQPGFKFKIKRPQSGYPSFEGELSVDDLVFVNQLEIKVATNPYRESVLVILGNFTDPDGSRLVYAEINPKTKSQMVVIYSVINDTVFIDDIGDNNVMRIRI